MNMSTEINFNKIMWAYWMIFVMFPWHSTANNLLKWITLSGNVTMLTLIALLIVVVLLLYAIKDGIRIKRTNIPVIFYCGFLIGAFFKGNAPITTKILDSGNILVQMVLFWGLQNKRICRKTTRDFLSLTVRLMNINYIINIIFYITRDLPIWGISSSDESRFGGGFFTLGIVTGIVALYSLCTEDKIVKKKEAYLTLLLVLFGLVISAVRTNLLVFLSLCCVILIATNYDGLRKSTLITKFLIIFAGVITLLLLSRGGSYIVERLTTTNYMLNDGNLKIRLSTMEYYWDLIKKNPLGMGFGYMVHFVHWNGSVLEDQLSLDNSLMYIAIKCGLPAAILFVYLVIVRPIKKIALSRNSKSFKISLISMWVGYIFAVGIMTNQIFFSLTNFAFIWAYLSVLDRDS